MGEIIVLSLNDYSPPCSHAGRSSYGENLGINKRCKEGCQVNSGVVLTSYVFEHKITPRPATLFNSERNSPFEVSDNEGPSGASGAASVDGHKERAKDIRTCSIILKEGRLSRARWKEEGKEFKEDPLSL